MNTHSNWPGGIDRAGCNFTGRTPRTSNWGGSWAPESHRIPKAAWVWAAVVAVVFVAIAFLGHGAGLK